MNEGKKTGIFWIAGALMLGVGGLVSWEPDTSQSDTDKPINRDLFEDFKDPLVASSMKIVTFDEVQGTLATFEIRKDRETGNWTIPSRDGYPADAVEQMKNAANSLVGLKVLDTIAAEPGDHDDFGVVEPNLEDLNVGDDGVGRLVTFKDADQKTLAAMIIGDEVKEREGQIYVRKPNQDLVYVVAFDDKPLTTKFQDWIEEDLLKISSIDIQDMEIKDYSAVMNPLNGQIALNKKYDASVSLDGSQWTLKELKEFDPQNPLAEPTIVQPGEDEELNATQLNAIKNALDDVKIADVVRKPEGMSANLKADKDLAADVKAKQSLARHGFFPVQLKVGGDVEILSANGELVVGLNDGVEYVLRFGNISGLSEEEEPEEEGAETPKTTGGVNRYLLVTTRINDAKFAPPDLKPIPQTIEDLRRLMAKEEEELEEPVQEGPPLEAPEKAVDGEQDAAKKDPAEAQPKEESKPADGDAEPDEPKADPTAPADDAEKAGEKTDAPEASDENADASAEKKETVEGEAETSGESELSGSGEATGSGQGQDPAQDEDAPQEKADEAKDGDAEKAEPETDGDKKADPPADDADKADTADEPKKSDDGEKADGDAGPEKAADDGDQATPAKGSDDKPAAEEAKPAVDPLAEMSDEEKQELLESEQEKITKENQRALDERKDKIEAAKRRVRDLNARFADWYYVVPEDTYSKLRIERDELFEKPADDKAPAGPGLNTLPPGAGGFPPGFPPPQ